MAKPRININWPDDKPTEKHHLTWWQNHEETSTDKPTEKHHLTWRQNHKETSTDPMTNPPRNINWPDGKPTKKSQQTRRKNPTKKYPLTRRQTHKGTWTDLIDDVTRDVAVDDEFKVGVHHEDVLLLLGVVLRQRPRLPSGGVGSSTNLTGKGNDCYPTSQLSFPWTEHVPLVEFMYFVFTRMLGESYCRQLRSLWLCLCDVFRARINSLAWFCICMN